MLHKKTVLVKKPHFYVKRLLFYKLNGCENTLFYVNKNALSREFCCQRPRCCYTTFSFGILPPANECCMS